MKKNYLSAFLLGSLLVAGTAKAQLVINGTKFSNSGYVSNYSSYTEVKSSSNSTYSASNRAVFEHFETSPQALRIDNAYEANLADGGIDEFKGPNGSPGVQGVSGSVAPNFHTLILNNGATFQITNSNGANVYGSAQLNNGITTTNRSLRQTGALRFQNGATYQNGNTDARHVNGYVSKVGNNEFTFPVGSGSDLRTLRMSAPSANSHFSTAWNASQPANTSTKESNVQAIAAAGFWDWITVTPSSTPLTITVSIPDLSTFAVAENLRLVGWNGSQWVALSGGPSASGNTENSTLQGTIPANSSTITALAIGSSSGALPVSLAGFTAKAVDAQKVVLDWVTAGEKNNAFFEVQHSINAQQYETLGKVEGQGTTYARTNYKFSHEGLSPATIHYYRLKQVDLDGSFTYSPVRSVKLEGYLGIELYATVEPGRTVKAFVKYGDDQLSDQATLSLVDLSGRKLSSKAVSLQKGTNPVEFSAASLGAGLYLIRLENASQNSTVKVAIP